MRVKDLKIGQKVWFSTSPTTLMKGEGEQVQVHAIGRYTKTWEPCGALITPTTAPGPTKVVLKFTIAKGDNSCRNWLAKFGAESSATAFHLIEGGRGLMHEDEHKVMRDAAADRKLERDAHQQLGDAITERAIEVARKSLHEAGLPVELLDLSFDSHNHYDRRLHEYRSGVRVDLSVDALRKLISGPELARLTKEWDAWKKRPVPGTDCVI